MKPYLSEFIKFANSLADTASETSMYYFRKKINIENKDDESPVTIADKKTEEIIRDQIRKTYPNHGILGEEYENEKLDSEFIWVIDPIDGTRSYIAGHRDFGNLISLLHNNKPVIENTDMFTWAIFKEGSLKEIRVDKVLKEINSCKFSTGISTLKAIKK